MEFDVSAASDLELILTSQLVLVELRQRNVIRSANLVGDFGEYLAAAMYEVPLARKGEAGFDLIDATDRRIQVKTRTSGGKLSGMKYSRLGDGGFDVCLFVCVELDSFRPQIAREVEASRVAGLLDSKGRVTVSKIRNEGIDRLDTAVAAYEAATAVK